MSQHDEISYLTDSGYHRFRITVLLVIAFCVVATSLVFFVLSLVTPSMGVTLSMDGHDWRVESVDTNGVAYRAEVKEGDTPIEMNGQPAEIFLEKYRKAGVVFGILIRDLTVTDAAGQNKSVSLSGSAPSVRSVIEASVWFMVSVVFWVVGFFVFLRRPNHVAAWLLCICSLVFGLALSANIAADRAIPLGLQPAVGAALFGPWFLLHFLLVLPEERTRVRNSHLIYLLYLPPTVTLLLFFVVGYADGQPIQWFRNVRFVEAGAVFIAAVGVAVINFIRAGSIRTRQQMKIILISCLVALVPPLVLNILPTAIWSQPIMPGTVSIPFIAFVPLGMGYAVVSQKLMDIDVIIRRGIIYGSISVMMAIILSAAILPVLLFRKLIGVPEAMLIVLVLGGIATFLFGPAKRGTEKLADRLFYKDRYDYRQIVQNVSTALNLVKDIAEASRLIVGTTVRTLNLNGGALFVKAQSGSLEMAVAQGIYTDLSQQAELLTAVSRMDHSLEFPNSASPISPSLAFSMPLSVGEEQLGVLCVSQKVSRQDFSADDLFLLEGLASIAAMALHRTILIRDVSLRDTFVSIASHELRTPLTAILGYADLLLRRDPPDATRKRWLRSVFDNTQRVASMVDDLLNVSRIQSGRVTVKLEKTSLPDVLEETLSLARESSKKHEFVIDMESNLPDAVVDRDKFGQVVGNLLSNAVKYSPAGGRVTLSIRSNKERREIVVSVADEGIGIAPEDRATLFKTFHRIQRPETQGIKGSGLGLYIAKEWTEAMGGKIWVESELNKGSIFFIGIPTTESGKST